MPGQRTRPNIGHPQPLRRTHQRVPKCRLTSHDTVFGTHDDTIGRATYLYEITSADAAPPGEFEVGIDAEFPEAGPQLFYVSGSTVSDPDASNRYSPLVGPYISDTARDWNYRPCHQAQ